VGTHSTPTGVRGWRTCVCDLDGHARNVLRQAAQQLHRGFRAGAERDAEQPHEGADGAEAGSDQLQRLLVALLRCLCRLMYPAQPSGNA